MSVTSCARCSISTTPSVFVISYCRSHPTRPVLLRLPKLIWRPLPRMNRKLPCSVEPRCDFAWSAGLKAGSWLDFLPPISLTDEAHQGLSPNIHTRKNTCTSVPRPQAPRQCLHSEDSC